jgi:tetraacyldisaccharide 4'-kinase
MLLDHLRKMNIRTAVVGRNYRGSLRGTARVEALTPGAAFIYGDEPTQLAQNNPDVPVFVGPIKWRAAWQAEKEFRPQVILLDDGFQHRALHRDLDLVLMDATAEFGDYAMLPLGLGREPVESLERADFVILSKVNFTDELKLEAIQRMIPPDVPVIQLAYRLETTVEDTGLKVLAIAGLAHPETFKKSIQQDTLYELSGFLTFSDHHPYSINDLVHMKEVMKSSGAEALVMTEKDFVKIDPLLRQNPIFDLAEIRVLKLQTHFLEGAADFYASLERLISAHSPVAGPEIG